MLVFLMAFFLSGFFSWSVFAQDMAPAASGEDVCRALAAHQAGAGVHHVGDSAVPADITPFDGGLGVVHIPVTLDLAQRFGLVLPAGVELKPDVAVMGIYPDGRVTYNGQDLSADIAGICAQGGRENGHSDADGLGSSSVVK